MTNVLLMTDVYKMGHMEQYAPGITKVYSYLQARSNKEFLDLTFFGLRYYLQKYLMQPILPEHGEEFLALRKRILGSNSPGVERKIRALCALGYWPLKIKAVKEGDTYPTHNVLLTITNTHADFYWCVGFVESLLLKLWYPCTVATHVRAYRKVVEEFYNETCGKDESWWKDYAVHDFGYRGDSSEESAQLSGGAHLLYFKGSDTVVAQPFMDTYYPHKHAVMQSVPASEHSVMCSFGIDGELEAFRHMLRTYPTGTISIVSDTYNLWRVMTEYIPLLKEEILARDGKVVFRPDSGDPKDIICGTSPLRCNTPEETGCLKLLAAHFGFTVNEKGYKVLHPKVGLIYGDGMYLRRYKDTLELMKIMGFAASNLIIGVGGLLRSHTRDTLGFAIKATHVVVNGEARDIMKDPVTDHSKRSHSGLLCLIKNENGTYATYEHCNVQGETLGELKTVFKNGRILSEETGLQEPSHAAEMKAHTVCRQQGEHDCLETEPQLSEEKARGTD